MLARVISVLSLFVLVVGFATAQDITAIHGKWIGTSEDDRGNVLVIEKDVIVLGGRPIREPVAWMGQAQSVVVTLPPLAGIILSSYQVTEISS